MQNIMKEPFPVYGACNFFIFKMLKTVKQHNGKETSGFVHTAKFKLCQICSYSAGEFIQDITPCKWARLVLAWLRELGNIRLGALMHLLWHILSIKNILKNNIQGIKINVQKLKYWSNIQVSCVVYGIPLFSNHTTQL